MIGGSQIDDHGGGWTRNQRQLIWQFYSLPTSSSGLFSTLTTSRAEIFCLTIQQVSFKWGEGGDVISIWLTFLNQAKLGIWCCFGFDDRQLVKGNTSAQLFVTLSCSSLAACLLYPSPQLKGQYSTCQTCLRIWMMGEIDKNNDGIVLYMK